MLRFSPQNFHPSFTGIHIKEIILKDHISPALDLNGASVGFGGNDDLAAFDISLMLWIGESEVLGCAEEHGATPDQFSILVEKFIGIIAIVETVL